MPPFDQTLITIAAVCVAVGLAVGGVLGALVGRSKKPAPVPAAPVKRSPAVAPRPSGATIAMDRGMADDLAAAATAAPEAILVMNEELRLTAFNPAAITMVTHATGTEPKLGERAEALLPALPSAVWADRIRYALGGVSVKFDLPIVAANGSKETHEVCLTPMRANGRVTAVAMTSRDATESRMLSDILVDSEARFRSMVEAAADPLLVAQVNGDVTFASGALERELAWAPDQFVGRNLLTLAHEDDVESLRGLLRDTGARPLEPRAASVRLRHGAEGFRRLEARARGWTARNGTTDVVLNVRDISDRQTVQHELRSRVRDESTGRFVGSVAHDLNNQITAILGNVDLAMTGSRSEELTEIQQAGERARKLVKHLQNFTDGAGGAPETFSVNKRLGEMKGLLGRLIGNDVMVINKFDEDLAWPVSVNVAQFEQMVVNLAFACRAAMPNGGRLYVETRPVRVTQGFVGPGPRITPGDYVTFSLTDSGTIPIDELPDASVRAPEARSSLAVADALAQRAGGCVWVYREKGFGACYRVFLPRHRDVGEIDEAASAAVPVRYPKGSGTVLIAEDDSAIRGLTGRLLRDQGFSVIEAENGRSAVELAKAHGGTIDLLVTDLVMPQMSGIELVAQLRTKRPQMRVVLMSGYTANTAQRDKLAGIRHRFLGKPFMPPELLQAVTLAMKN
jgi:PAS domain S-box-containing protein